MNQPTESEFLDDVGLKKPDRSIEDWREDYNGIRGHESLGNRPPAAYLPRFVKPENSIYDLST